MKDTDRVYTIDWNSDIQQFVLSVRYYSEIQDGEDFIPLSGKTKHKERIIRKMISEGNKTVINGDELGYDYSIYDLL